MKIVVDYDKCTSNAVCMGIAPEVFEVRDDNFLYLLQEEPGEELRPKMEEAVRMCPTAGHLHRGVDPHTCPWTRSWWWAPRSRGCARSRRLRRDGFAGRLVLVGAEPHLPYDRPPLSKELLAGDWEHDQIVLRRTPYEDLDLELRLGLAATSLDLDRRVVTLAEGTELAFDGLVIATGATPRRLPGQPDLDGVFTLRTIDDCYRLRARLDAGPRVCVIGAGFIGSEVAATCRKRGLDVTVLEALPQPMVRGVGPVLGRGARSAAPRPGCRPALRCRGRGHRGRVARSSACCSATVTSSSATWCSSRSVSCRRPAGSKARD